MISREEWESMTPEEQQQTCMSELADMLETASDSIYYTPSGEDTRVLTGNTTIIMRRDDEVR